MIFMQYTPDRLGPVWRDRAELTYLSGPTWPGARLPRTELTLYRFATIEVHSYGWNQQKTSWGTIALFSKIVFWSILDLFYINILKNNV